MNRLFIHNPFFRLGSGLLLGILVYLLILLINNTIADVNRIFSTGELYVCIGLSYIAIESMRGVIQLLEKRFQRLDFQQRVFLQVAGSLGLALALVSLAIAHYYRWVIGFSIGAGELHLFLVIYGFAGLLYNILYFSQYYLQRENKTRMDEEASLREKVEADFASFKSEINPELLYDSLENLILTIHFDAESAEEQIDYLAGIYRYSLINRHKEIVSFEEEVAAAQSLIHLLNFRYSGNLSIRLEAAISPEIHLIPGSLLITIDTIVRNTLVSTHAPLQLHMYPEEDDNYLVIQHKVNDRLVQHTESLQTYARLQRSYSFFAERPFLQVKAGGENFIKFPVIRLQPET